MRKCPNPDCNGIGFLHTPQTGEWSCSKCGAVIEEPKYEDKVLSDEALKALNEDIKHTLLSKPV